MAGNGPKPPTQGKRPIKVELPVAKATEANPVAAKAAFVKPAKPVAAPEPPLVRAEVPVATPAPAMVAPPVLPPVLAAVEPVVAPIAAAPAAEEPVAAPAAPEPEIITPSPAVPALSPAVLHKEEIIMEATINQATDNTQAFLGDATGRAKTAMEKGTKMFEEMNAFSKGNIEAVVESGKIAAKGMEVLGQDAAEYTRKQFEGATVIMKSLASVKSPTELFKLQSDFFRSSFDSLVAESSKTTEAVMKLAGEVAQPISNRVALAAEKVKMAA